MGKTGDVTLAGWRRGMFLILILIPVVAGGNPGQPAENPAPTDAARAADKETTGFPPEPSTAPGEADWPMFRGQPSLRGVSSSSLPDAPSLLWSFNAGDAIKSSAAVGRGKVYFGSDNGMVFALDAESGDEVWSFQTGDVVESSPCILEGTVFVGSADGFLYALDADTGKLRWKYETGDRILGGVNWTAAPGGRRTWVVAGSYDTILHCVDAQTGEGVWTYETQNYINGTPAVSDGLVIFGGCDAAVHAVPIAHPENAILIDAGSYIAGSAAVEGPKVYVGHYGNELLCIDLEKKAIEWRYHDREFPFFSSPAVSASRVVIGSRDKRLHCVGKKDGAAVWTFPTGGKVDSSPVICGDRVVFGSDDGRLYTIRLADGVQEWAYDIGDSITASPAVAAGKVYIGAGDGRMRAFGARE